MADLAAAFAAVSRTKGKIKVGDVLDTGFGWRLRVTAIDHDTLARGSWRDGTTYVGLRWNVAHDESTAHVGRAHPEDVEAVNPTNGSR